MEYTVQEKRELETFKQRVGDAYAEVYDRIELSGTIELEKRDLTRDPDWTWRAIDTEADLMGFGNTPREALIDLIKELVDRLAAVRSLL